MYALDKDSGQILQLRLGFRLPSPRFAFKIGLLRAANQELSAQNCDFSGQT
jgi:hypothetical protein